MTWRRIFRIRLYIRDSLWVMPLTAALLGVILGSVDVAVERSLQVSPAFQYSASTASTLLSTLVGATAALTGFVVTVTTLVVQMATGSFSARYMRLWYRDRILKVLLALLLGTLAFSFSLMRRVETNFVPNVGISIAGVFLILSLLVFLVFLDGYLHRLRPVAVAAIVHGYFLRNFGHEVHRAGNAEVFVGVLAASDEAPSLAVHSHRPGAIQAVHAEFLLRWAQKHDCLLVLRHAIGDFVPSGAVLMDVYGGRGFDHRSAQQLRDEIALGDERTIEQDPAFAIRILVDVANLALSPAVNDPTTAIQVLDYLGEALRVVGATDLAVQVFDPSSRPQRGVMIPARSWEDYLTLTVNEIREYGRGGIQVMRRLRAMLDELYDEVRPEFRPAITEELARLDATVKQSFGDSVDLDRANVADTQGIGGPRTRSGDGPK